MFFHICGVALIPENWWVIVEIQDFYFQNGCIVSRVNWIQITYPHFKRVIGLSFSIQVSNGDYFSVIRYSKLPYELGGAWHFLASNVACIVLKRNL